MLNTCTITGNLGADPDVFYNPDGNSITSFNLAFQSSRNKTNWIKITCFNRLAEVASKYLHKGARVAISGILDQQKWQTDSGENRSSYQLILNSIEFIRTDGRGFKEGETVDDVPF